MKNDVFSEVQNVLKNKQEILACYIFGSFVEGHAARESDFDIAFVVDDKKNINEKKIYNLIKNIHFPKDLDITVVDKKSSPLFLFQIINKGKRIYESDKNKADSFEASVLLNYYDTQHIRNIYYKYLKKAFL
ncbi:MAG: nucleotidyltransferase domain-containing protein [Candidatus Levybacteria bacterium]|nr:nucleotidyltransferase domain-containing protein [Candidatus Levybacteria bacterium]